MKRLNISWRSGEGYGDFITAIGYAYTSRVKYDIPVSLHMHWPNAEGHLLSNNDKEDIKYRYDKVVKMMKPCDGVEVIHHYNSKPKYRYINNFEHKNPLQGLWFPRQQYQSHSNIVMLWSSLHNLTYPGKAKDPTRYQWNDVINYIENEGYDVHEVTYRTPVKDVIYLLKHCEFGIGYEGMVQQLFKFLWKPLIVIGERTKLSTLMCPQGCNIKSHKELFDRGIDSCLIESEDNIRKYNLKYKEHLNQKYNPFTHRLYGKEVGN